MAQASGTLTTTGNATLPKPATDTIVFFVFSGTYSVSGTFVGTYDGTTYAALPVIPQTTGVQQSSNTVTTTVDGIAFAIPCLGCSSVRFVDSTHTSGTLNWFAVSMPTENLPFINTSNALTQTFPGSGTIGASTAAAGSTFADAGALPAGTAKIYPTTAADDATGVIISTVDKVTGNTLFIGNGVSNKILKVYGPSGAVINGAAANAAFSSASGGGVLITCLSGSGNTWLAL